VALAAGLLAGLVVLVAGVGYLKTRPEQWSAKTTVLVAPQPNIPVGTAASYYDTLSTGQIPATVANILGLARFKTTAVQELRLSASQANSVTVTATTIPTTTLVTVSATAPTESVATQVADAVVAQATPAIDAAVAPYQISVMSQSGATATRSASTSSSKFLVVLVVVALALGVGVQQGLAQVTSLWRMRRSRDDVDGYGTVDGDALIDPANAKS